MDDLKEFGLELEEVKGLLDSTAQVEEPDHKENKLETPQEDEEKEELVRITIRVTPDMEDELLAYQRKLRRKGVSKRDSSLNAIILSAIKPFLKRKMK